MTTNLERAAARLYKKARTRADNRLVDFVFVVAAGDCQVGVSSFFKESAQKLVRNRYSTGWNYRTYLSIELKSPLWGVLSVMLMNYCRVTSECSVAPPEMPDNLRDGGLTTVPSWQQQIYS